MNYFFKQIYKIYKNGFNSIDFSADRKLVWNTN